MAGKLGLAAKIFLGSTVLAGSGAGTWYATTHNLPQTAELLTAGTATTAEIRTTSKSAPAPRAAADLDAVASAWGEPDANLAKSTVKSSPVARSAENVSTEPDGRSSESPIQSPKVGSRYALSDVPADVDQERVGTTTTPETKLADVAASEPAQNQAATVESEDGTAQPTPEIDPRAIVENAPELAEANVAASETAKSAEIRPPASVARGQEPAEESDLQALTSDSQNAEPQPIATHHVDQARQAFQSSQPANASGRYRAADASNSAITANGGQQGIANPFVAGGSSSQQAAAYDQTLRPLTASPDSVAAGGLKELPQADELQPLRSDLQAEPAPLPTPTNNLRSPRSLPGRGNTRPSDFAQLPTTAGDRSNAIPSALAEGEGAGTPGEKALEGPQKPSLEIQKFAPVEIQVGKPAKFVVRVRNLGTQAAEGVAIRDQVPQGTKLVSTTPEAQVAGGDLLWDLGKLSPGEDRTVEMQLMPVSEGDIGSVATVSYSAQASVKTKCTMPQLAIRMTAPAKVMIGQEQRVKIELRNPGSGDATGVMLFENVPQNVKHAAGPTLEFDIGTLKAGETRELELVLMAEKAGKTVNVLSARGDGNLQVEQQVEFEVIAPALTVDVDGPERRYLERPATYEVRVDNPGTAPAHNVQIVTKLPKGLRFVRANNKGEYDATTHAVYWSLAELPEGEHGVVELVAMPIEAGPQTLEVESRAGQGLSDQAQQQIVIDGLAAIKFELKDLEDPIEVGGETGYEIRVVNQGTKAATNVQVAVNLPPGMQLVSAEGESQHSEQRGAIVFEPLAQLAAKADTVYRVRVQGTAAGDQRVMVQVNTDDLGQPIRREESTRVFGDE